MIIGLHHISLAYSDLDAGIRTYRELLGREPSARSEEDGAECAYFMVENSALRIVSPRGNGLAAERIRQTLQSKEGTLFEIAFSVADAARARQQLKRISLWPGKIQDFETRDLLRPDVVLAWRMLEFDNGFSNGVNIRLVEPLLPLPTSKAFADAPILRTELVVIQTADPERALGFFGARLNLELLFDRSNADNGSRLAQFACKDVLIELSHTSASKTPGQLDTIWGLGWSVADAEAVHNRLKSLGRNVSPVKDGAKPGTRVFTIRDGTCGIPTLVVQHVETLEPAGR